MEHILYTCIDPWSHLWRCFTIYRVTLQDRIVTTQMYTKMLSRIWHPQIYNYLGLEYFSWVGIWVFTPLIKNPSCYLLAICHNFSSITKNPFRTRQTICWLSSLSLLWSMIMCLWHVWQTTAGCQWYLLIVRETSDLCGYWTERRIRYVPGLTLWVSEFKHWMIF